MKVISVAGLDGIPQQGTHDLYSTMKRCTNGQRLVVCLYLMSDLPISRHHLSDIERELTSIFPPSLGHKYSPGDYANFQASAIRGLFNRETQDVEEGSLQEEDRLWINVRRGHWKNTDLGNRTARQILRDREILVQKDGSVLNPSDEQLPQITRPYMEEELAEAAQQEPDLADSSDEAESENLLAHVDRLLSNLPEIDFSRIPEDGGPSLRVQGDPTEVSRVLRQLADSVRTREVRVSITISQGGWRVQVQANESKAQSAEQTAVADRQQGKA